MYRVVHIITGLKDGGAEAVLFRLCCADKMNQHQVVSLTDEGKHGSLLRAKGVPVECIHMPRGRLTISGLINLWRILRKLRPDVVQTWMYHADLIGGLVAIFAGVPKICWNIRNSNLDKDRSKRTTIWVRQICAYLSSWIPDLIVCCAQMAEQTHVELGYDAGKFVVIPNGYDFSAFKPDYVQRERLRMEWGIAHDIPLIGMVGRFHAQKDHANLITSLAKVSASAKAFNCILIGDGLELKNSELAGWIHYEGLGEHIRLLGSRNDISAVMNALDLHVLSSCCEGFPNVLAEAMACGTPCVTTDVGDAAIIVGSTGWVVPRSDSAALAVAIQSALTEWKDKVSWVNRQRMTRDRIRENYSIKKMVSSYRELWNEVVK